MSRQAPQGSVSPAVIKLQLLNACYFLVQCTEELFPANAMTTGEKKVQRNSVLLA